MFKNSNFGTGGEDAVKTGTSVRGCARDTPGLHLSGQAPDDRLTGYREYGEDGMQVRFAGDKAPWSVIAC